MSTLSKPFDIGDVAHALRDDDNLDLGTLCREAWPWCKRKPIRYYTDSSTPFDGELTDAQYSGTTSEINAGYYNGVRITPTNLTTAGNFTRIHDITFDYHYPRGLANNEMCRLLDFNGYDDSQPMPTLYGSIPSSGTAGQTKTIAITINYTLPTTNTTGFDFSAAAASLYGSTWNMQNCYPFILLSDTSRSKYYCQALWNNSTGTVTTLYSSKAWQKNFYCNITTMPSGGLSKTGTYIASLFVAIPASSDSPLVTTGAWFQVTTSKAFKTKAFGIPFAIGKSVTIDSSAVAPPSVSPTDGEHPASSVAGFKLNIRSNSTSTDTRNVEYQISLGPAQGSTSTYKGSFNPSSIYSTQLDFAWSIFHLSYPYSEGEEVPINITIMTRWSGSSTWDTRTKFEQIFRPYFHTS